MHLLDVQYDNEDSTVTRWIKNNDSCLPLIETYYPEIYISGNPELKSLLSTLPGVVSSCFDKKKRTFQDWQSQLLQ
jgi:hypothetical protein